MRYSKPISVLFLGLGVLAAACSREKTSTIPARSDASAFGGLTFAPDITDRLRKLARTPIDYDHSLLDAKETQVIGKLIDASRYMNDIFLSQVWAGNVDLRNRVVAATQQKDPTPRWALALFDVHKGPWDRLAANSPFIGKDPKPPGAGFYPTDMSKQEFEKWVADHPADKAAFEGLYTVIRRQGREGLVAIPYSKAYGEILQAAAETLRQAATLTGNASLRDYLNKRADAFLSDDYFASDVAWMDLDSDIEVVIGPYEVYEDALFNYKAAFESFVTVRDKAESEKLSSYARHLPDMERALPIPDQHKNLKRKFESPIRVVQEIYTAGDARRGVQTSAFNLPNDEKVREAKGSKKVLLKNVMDAKFRQCGKPVAERTIASAELANLSFDAYFNHTLFHELSHGLGPGIIVKAGQRVDSRLLLKELYSTIEECKADVTGLWNILLSIDRKWLTGVTEAQIFSTYNGLMFRGMRFGVDEAHGQGTAVQWNWFREKGAVVPVEDGRFRSDPAKYREAIRSLANELLMIEATGDYARARALLDKYGKSNTEIDAAVSKLADIPVDITPVFVAAGEQ